MAQHELLKKKYETGGFTALTSAEIVEFFNIPNTPENFIYVINCLDGMIKRALYLDPNAVTDQWYSRRTEIMEKFPQHHDAYNAFINKQ